MTSLVQHPRLVLFPETSQIDAAGHLQIGGCDTTALAERFGTPLYVFDEETLRQQCRRFLKAFQERHPDVVVAYACKAFVNRALLLLLNDEGLGLDVVSGGELSFAHSVHFPLERVYFHGNNKSPEELRLALDWGVGRIVVDNFQELALLEELARAQDTIPNIFLRLSPGVDPHTHAHTTTGVIDSKFGFAVANGQAAEALHRTCTTPHLALRGLHLHLGSPIFETEPFRVAIQIALDFAAAMRARYGFELQEFSPGGGFAVQYTVDTPAPPPEAYAEVIVKTLQEETARLGLPLPRLIVEPGRAIVGRAGVALYRVGAIKEIPHRRTYVSLDGGMADNIRPVLYGARYEALVANRALEPEGPIVTLAGKYCESGDVLVKDIALPPLTPGDLIAIPVSGAYCLAMASNYNASLKPAIVLVRGGKARLIRRPETFEDLVRCDVIEQ